jgi:riboflavin-specific deaminase-like protein
MQRVFPLPSQDLDVEQVYKDLRFPDAPVDRPYLVLNFVQSIDGQTTLGDQGVTGLGSAVDHRLMQRLRMTADALMHGAGTVRKDNFPPRVAEDLEPERIARGLARQTFGVVVSGTGDLSLDNRYFTYPDSIIVASSMHASKLEVLFGDRARVLPAGIAKLDLRQALSALRTEFGVRIVVCEGGPILAHSLVSQGLVDEIFLTIAPKLAGDRMALRLLEGHAFALDALPHVELLHILVEGSELFLRYRLSGVTRGAETLD